MSCKSSRNWMLTALVAGAGAISVASLAGMAGVMSMEKMDSRPHQVMGMRKGRMHGADCGCGMHAMHPMHGMCEKMSCMGEEFADEICSMAHKTGNAMIKTGRIINRMVP